LGYSVQLVSSRRTKTVFIAGRGDVGGDWLIVDLKVKEKGPVESLNLESVRLLSSGNDGQKPFAVDGSRKRDAPMFLRLGEVPGILEHWGTLKQQTGEYFGAFYHDPPGKMLFAVTASNDLVFQSQVRVVRILLLFETHGSGPHRLKVTDALTFPIKG